MKRQFLKNVTIGIFIFYTGISSGFSQSYQANWESLNQRSVPEWFTDAKFGIFIHWGVYSVPAWAPADADIGIYAKYAEWYWKRIKGGNDPNNYSDEVNNLFREHHNKIWGPDFKYQDFAPKWKAEHFNPQQWAKIIKNSGAKYVILTSKHHDGFTLWPSKESWNWNSMDVGPHRDICKELSKAVKSEGLKMGLYYSLYEWFNPLYNENPEKYVETHMIPQMKDLVNRYKPELLYADGEWDHPSSFWKSEQFLAWLYNESPVKNTVVVNDRWGAETRSRHGGYYSTEYGQIHGDQQAGDMSAHPWEEIRGIGTSFGFNRAENLDHYLSSKELIKLLIRTVSEGGNLCLNIGPTSDGRIPVIMQQRLSDIGNWLKVNGDAIYGTSPWKGRMNNNKNNSPVFFTTKENSLFAILTEWTFDSVELEVIGDVRNISLLGSNSKVKFKKKGSKLKIIPPRLNPESNCNYAWVYKIELND